MRRCIVSKGVTLYRHEGIPIPTVSSKEHSRTVGEISAALVDDAWEVIATTKNAFGWNIDTRTS